MITGVHHVSYSVSDLDRSLRFYSEGLGFQVLSDRITESPFASTVTGLSDARLRIAHLRAHGQGLELIQYLDPVGAGPPAPRPCDVGSSHICFIVDDVDGELGRLQEYGADPVSQPQTVDGGPNAGNRCVYFRDPDGIIMELTEAG